MPEGDGEETMTIERAEGKPAWDEEDSREFLDDGRFFVPEREAQVAAICTLIPDIPEPPEPAHAAPVHIVELCCGEGLLSGALLARLPRAVVHGYDGSEAMLAHARAALAAHGDRFLTRRFDLQDAGWRRFPWPVHAFVTSLALHHLDGTAKRRLFADLAAALAPGGALVIADLVLPASPEATDLAAAVWDLEVRRRSLDLAGDLRPYQRFVATGWNLFEDPAADPTDTPSPLFDQLRWLAEAGLEAVDVYWMKAGHAIYGGRKPRSVSPPA
jgi:tRNA (cmo5U34)-methyltransferase